MDSLNKSTEEHSLHFLDYWRVIRSRKEVILAVTLLVALSGFFASSLMTKRYKATCRIKIYQANQSMQVFDQSQRMNQYNPYFLLTEIEVLRSELILGDVVDKKDLATYWGEKYTKEKQALTRAQAIELLKNRISIQQQRNTSNIDITVVSDSPEMAADLANLIAKAYEQQRIRASVEEVQLGLATLEQVLEEKNQEVIDAEDRLEEIREETGLTTFNYGINISAETERVRNLQADLMAYRVDMLTREARLNQLEKLDGEGLVNSLLMSVPDRSLEMLRSQMIDAEIQLKMLLESLGENHPDVRRVRAGLTETKSRLQSAVEGLKLGLRTDYEVSKSKVESLEAELAKVEQAAREAQSRKLLPFTRAERDVKFKRTILTSLQARVAQEGVDIALPRMPMEIFESARPPEQYFSPNFTLNIALSLFVGVVFGVGLAFFIEYLDTSVKTVDDVERYLSTPVVGVIPQKIKPLNQEGPESPHAESYRVLRTNLQFANEGKRGGAFAVCSGGVGEGKSTTLFNLGYVCAMMGDKVLIVDSDMRRPVQHTILGMSNREGLVNVLMRDLPIEEAIKPTEHENLHFLSSGRLPRNAVGMLDTQRVRDLIKNLKARYDVVLFDSPPIMGVSDSSIIASEVDGVLLVVQYRKYPRQMSSRAKRLVENVGGKVMGVVLNNINILRDDYYYYYSSYYSHYADTKTTGHKENDDGARDAMERF
jgi:capsular exopolysaccharide synthesis family protein